MDNESVRFAVISRLGWIRRHQQAFAKQIRQSQREMVTKESHYFLGRRYLLDVKTCNGTPRVRIVENSLLELCVPPEWNQGQREAMLQRWYRHQLKALLPALLAKWEPRIGKKVSELRIRKMKTRWGSCNVDAQRIWLNLELIKKPIQCLEYVLVHEWVHLHERHHNERFQAWMNDVLPNWRSLRDEWNCAPLACKHWTY